MTTERRNDAGGGMAACPRAGRLEVPTSSRSGWPLVTEHGQRLGLTKLGNARQHVHGPCEPSHQAGAEAAIGDATGPCPWVRAKPIERLRCQPACRLKMAGFSQCVMRGGQQQQAAAKSVTKGQTRGWIAVQLPRHR